MDAEMEFLRDQGKDKPVGQPDSLLLPYSDAWMFNSLSSSSFINTNF